MKTIKRGNIINKRWKWIARDSDDELYAYADKPTKSIVDYHWTGMNFINVTDLIGDTLDNINWEDEEPTKIED